MNTHLPFFVAVKMLHISLVSSIEDTDLFFYLSLALCSFTPHVSAECVEVVIKTDETMALRTETAGDTH